MRSSDCILTRPLLALLGTLLAVCPVKAEQTFFAAVGSQSGQLVIESVTDLSAITPLIAAFQATEPGVAIVYDERTSNALNAHVEQACLEQRFVADLVLSSSIDQQLKLVNDGCAQPLTHDVGAPLPDWAKWRDELFGLTFEPAVIVYNKQLLSPEEVPRNRFDLVGLLRDPSRFSGKIGTYDIEASGVGYLFAFEDAAQASTWGRLSEGLGRNAARLYCCTSQILEAVSKGELVLGYNVLGSYALARAESDPHLGVVMPADYTLVLARAAFVPKKARQPGLARKFIEFALSPKGRKILSGKERLFSPIEGASDLQNQTGLAPFDHQTLRPIALTPALLVGLDAAKRRQFLAGWRDAINSANSPGKEEKPRE